MEKSCRINNTITQQCVYHILAENCELFGVRCIDALCKLLHNLLQQGILQASRGGIAIVSWIHGNVFWDWQFLLNKLEFCPCIILLVQKFQILLIPLKNFEVCTTNYRVTKCLAIRIVSHWKISFFTVFYNVICDTFRNNAHSWFQ